jgi:hypothetical protein
MGKVCPKLKDVSNCVCLAAGDNVPEKKRTWESSELQLPSKL